MITVNTTPKVISRSQTLFDPSSSAPPTYIGKGSEGLAQTSNGWLIYKFTYSGTGITQIQTGLGAWSNRASSVVYS